MRPEQSVAPMFCKSWGYVDEVQKTYPCERMRGGSTLRTTLVPVSQTGPNPTYKGDSAPSRPRTTQAFSALAAVPSEWPTRQAGSRHDAPFSRVPTEVNQETNFDPRFPRFAGAWGDHGSIGPWALWRI